MSSIYFIADTHFSDENIIQYENRPFQNITQMNNEIIYRWNCVIKNNDIVYILGDFGAEKNEYSILSQLNGNNTL